MVDIKEIIKIIPKDKFYDMRVRNISTSIDREIEYEDGEIASVIFINRKYGLKFVTWITNEKYRKKGYASRALTRIRKRHSFLFAKVWGGNIPSYKFALKNGFKVLFNTSKLPFMRLFNFPFGTFFYWKK